MRLLLIRLLGHSLSASGFWLSPVCILSVLRVLWPYCLPQGPTLAHRKLPCGILKVLSLCSSLHSAATGHSNLQTFSGLNQRIFLGVSPDRLLVRIGAFRFGGLDSVPRHRPIPLMRQWQAVVVAHIQKKKDWQQMLAQSESSSAKSKKKKKEELELHWPERITSQNKQTKSQFL